MTNATAAAHRDFILANLAPLPVAAVPEITLYTAHERSGLGRLKTDAPYFAYPWPGGIALARHLLDHPAIARDRRVLDLGTGSGLVAIAAARCGARVTAVDIDPLACAAARLNAEINGVAFDILDRDLLDEAPPAVDLVLAGDVFYAPGLARRAAAFLLRCAEAGTEVLVGDPGRADLPMHMLHPVAGMAVRDFGGGAGGEATVFRVEPPRRELS